MPLSLGIVLVFYLACSVLYGTVLVVALLFSAAGGPAFNSIVYAALNDQIGRLSDRPTGGQVVRAFVRELLPLRLHSSRKDLTWILEIEKRVERLPSESERYLAYASMERITNEDTPRTERLRKAVTNVASKAEERAYIAATVSVNRIRAATSIGQLRRLQWLISLDRTRMLVKAMLDDDMKARWFPFGGRFLDYLGRGGAFGLVVASAVGGDRSNLTAWAGWISNLGIVGGAVGSMFFIVACIKDIDYIDRQSDNSAARMKILPDNRLTRFATRYPFLFAPLLPTIAVLFILLGSGLGKLFTKATDLSGLSDTTVFIVVIVGMTVLYYGHLLSRRGRKSR